VLAVGFSLVNAPSVAATMDTLAPEEIGAGAAGNETTRELGGTLGVAVLGSVFASAYAPRVIRAFGPYPIPAGAKSAAHQSMAAALAVVNRAPVSVRPVLRAAAFTAFGSGLKIACVVGAGVAVVGAVAAFRFLPGRRETAGVTAPVLLAPVEEDLVAVDGTGISSAAPGSDVDSRPWPAQGDEAGVMVSGGTPSARVALPTGPGGVSCS